MFVTKNITAEHQRLEEARSRKAHWKRWGPYVSERAWGTVREDYSAHGTAWEFFPHDHARSRAYRWNEDGLAGICDRSMHLLRAVAMEWAITSAMRSKWSSQPDPVVCSPCGRLPANCRAA